MESGAQELWPKQAADYGEDEWEKELSVKLSPSQMDECGTHKSWGFVAALGFKVHHRNRFEKRDGTVDKIVYYVQMRMLIFLTFSFISSTEWIMVKHGRFSALMWSMNSRSFYSCLYKTIIAAVNCWGSSFNEHQSKCNYLQPLINKHRNLVVCK